MQRIRCLSLSLVLAVSAFAFFGSANQAGANTIYTLQRTNYTAITGTVTYAIGGMSANNLSGYSHVGTARFMYATYDVSGILDALAADPTLEIISAKLIYDRNYVGAGDLVQSTWTVVRGTMDYTLDTGSSSSEYHIAMCGGSKSAPKLVGTTPCTQAEVLNPLTGNYRGPQSVDITPIMQDWANGATNYGIGMGATVEEKLTYQPYFPYIEVTVGQVPEPLTMCLLAVGGVATLLRRRSC
jgi:hypothetical protein